MDVVIGFLIGSIFALVIGFILLKVLRKNQENAFKSLASDIMRENTEFLQQNSIHSLAATVNPINEQIKQYKEYLDQIHKYDLKDRESLREKLNQMLDSAQKIESEANLLSQALSSDVKFQGAWGELTLEKILELAGLEKGIEYFTQEVYTDDKGRVKRPDVVLKLPNDSQIIIDSKVSLKSYFDYINTDNKSEALKALRTSLVGHIDSLSKKEYQQIPGVNSPEFVYLFVPVESVYSLLLSQFPELIDEALKKNIVLVSPVNILSNLKTVASLWRLEKQSKNAIELATKAGQMYDKFVSFTEDLEKMGNHIQKAQSVHADAIKKLSTGKGNLVTRSEELKSLGAKTSKNLGVQIQ